MLTILHHLVEMRKILQDGERIFLRPDLPLLSES